jgi:hypothetical protein
MSMKLKVARNEGRWGRHNIPISENGEWRMENEEWRMGTALPFSILHSSINECAQMPHPSSVKHSPFSILQSMNALRLLNPTLAKHSPFALHPSPLSYFFFSGYKSRITKNAARYIPVKIEAYIQLRSSPA